MPRVQVLLPLPFAFTALRRFLLLLWLSRQSTSLVRTRSPVRIWLAAPMQKPGQRPGFSYTTPSSPAFSAAKGTCGSLSLPPSCGCLRSKPTAPAVGTLINGFMRPFVGVSFLLQRAFPGLGRPAAAPPSAVSLPACRRLPVCGRTLFTDQKHPRPRPRVLVAGFILLGRRLL